MPALSTTRPLSLVCLLTNELLNSSRLRVQSLYGFQGIHKVWLREEYTLNLEPGTLNQTSIAPHPDSQHLSGRAHLPRSAQRTTYPSFTPFNFCDAGFQLQGFGDRRRL